MEAIIGLIVIGIFFSPLIAVFFILRARLKKIERTMETLKGRLEVLESERTEPLPKDREVSAVPARQVDFDDPTPSSPPSPVGSIPHVVTPPEKSFVLLKKLEKQFVDNWTGILGAVIVVLGAGFISIFAALKMTEFYRFILLLLLSAVPGGLYFLLKGREKWQRQAAWMLSISGAVFLFACLGSGGIPGLQWVDNPFASLGLLILGIVVNLGLGTIGRKQYFASFHTLLSLLALVIIPPSTTTLFIAFVISFYAIIQTYRIRWDIHLLLTISAFFFYHLFWIFTLQEQGFTEMLRLQGVVVMTLIFTAAALIHYRKNYSTGRFELFPFLVHLVNWLYFSFAMILYLGEYQWRTIPLILAALASFLLADQAGKREISWLKSTDSMICQILTVSALLTLLGWDVRPVMICGLIYAESILFVRIMVQQKNRLLFRVGINLSHMATLFLIAFCLENSASAGAVICGSAVILSLLLHRTLERNTDYPWLQKDTFPFFKGKREFSLTGLFSGVLIFSLAATLRSWDVTSNAALPLTLPFLILLLFMLYKNPSRGLFTGALISLFSFSLMGWADLLDSQPLWYYLVTGFSLTTAGGASLFWLIGPGKKKSLRTPGYILISMTVTLLSYALLNPLSPFFPGLFWLIVAAGLVLIPSLPREITLMGLLFLVAFLLRHFFVHIKLDTGWGPVRFRYLLEALVIPVIFLWYRYGSYSKERETKWDRFFPVFMELGLIFTGATIFIEVPLPWRSFVLGILALAIIMVIRLTLYGKERSSRALFYSLLLNWTGILVLMVATVYRKSYAWFPLSGSLAVLVNLAYLVLFVRTGSAKKMILPSPLTTLTRLKLLMDRRIHALLLYPLTLGAALFIYAVFNPEILTLVWALECFLIFTASIFLKEEHFRYTSQAGLFLCVIRLIVVDLSESTILARGMVFLGVGILMLGVNSLYNRFKERFVKE
jgi:hypothetical protein